MTITVDWFEPDKTILWYCFEGKWTWDELDTAIREVNALLASVSHRVDIIVDVSGSDGVPPGALGYFRRATLKAADNWGMGVFVGVNPFTRALVNAFSRAYRRLGERYRVANSVDEARALILERRNQR